MTVTTILKGGTCNNLFQISNLLSYSIKYNIPYCIPTKIENPHSDGQQVFYSKYLTYCDKEYHGIKCYYNEKSFEYNEIPKQTCSYYILSGYFQSYLYFNDYREKILTLLDIPYEFKKDKCAICVRRGDYLNLPKYHNVPTSIYLRDAQIKMMNNGIGKFEVYSDDLSWCREFMPQFDNADYYFSEGKTDVEDLSLASGCEAVIMSASSFSWWAAWLGRNENRRVIYPAKWFAKGLAGHDTKDLCPSTWEAL